MEEVPGVWKQPPQKTEMRWPRLSCGIQRHKETKIRGKNVLWRPQESTKRSAGRMQFSLRWCLAAMLPVRWFMSRGKTPSPWHHVVPVWHGYLFPNFSHTQISLSVDSVDATETWHWNQHNRKQTLVQASRKTFRSYAIFFKLKTCPLSWPSHSRIQILFQKTSHPTLFRKCMRM